MDILASVVEVVVPYGRRAGNERPRHIVVGVPVAFSRSLACRQPERSLLAEVETGLGAFQATVAVVRSA